MSFTSLYSQIILLQMSSHNNFLHMDLFIALCVLTNCCSLIEFEYNFRYKINCSNLNNDFKYLQNANTKVKEENKYTKKEEAFMV